MSVCLLEPVGVIDETGDRSLLSQIQSDLKLGRRNFYIDFTAVESVEDRGLESLLQGLKSIADAGGNSFLLALNEDVRSLFVSKGLDLVLNILP
jgi:anti-anti-sigma regulatory factor